MKNKLALIFIFILGVVMYTLTIKGVNYNVQPSDFKNKLDQATKPLELSPERGRFAQTIALVEDHTYALSPQLAAAVFPDVGYYNGRYFSFFAPGISYMSVPFYIIGKHFNLSQIATYSFVSVVAILALLFLFKIARDIFKLPLWASLAVVMIFAFGCTSWSYAVTLYEHLFTVFFIISSFYAVWKYKQGRPWGWLWALFVWLNYALAISVDYPNALLMLPIMVYLLIASLKIWQENGTIKISLRPAILFTFLGFAVITGLHFYHNAYYFGSWKNLSSTLVGVKELQQKNVLQQANSAQAVEALAAKKTVSGFFSETNIPFSFYTLMVSSDRGIFLYCPIFLLALLGMYKAVKKLNLEYGVLLSLIAVNVLLYSSWGDPWGGWAYGPRYLIPSMAVSSLFLGIWISQATHRILAKIITFILFIYSSAIALLGVLTTNAVPPKVEAIPLHVQYNFLYNWQFFKQGKSSSFLYNTYISHYMTLTQYFFLIYMAILVIMAIILFILPRFEHEPEH